MHILALDTATRSCSVAITDHTAILAELTVVTRRTHATHLMGMIDHAIELSGLTVSDIDGFAVSKGPGSFTGLRIGIATVKGLASASEKPMTGVSTLDALAMQAGNTSFLICSLLDARRGEVYVARYRQNNGELEKLTKEGLLMPEDAICGIGEPCIFIGSGAVLYRKRLMEKCGEFVRFAPMFQHTIRASTIAHLAGSRFEAGNTDPVESFVPVYIRKSDAEINLARANEK